jgi:hypothetical protein
MKTPNVSALSDVSAMQAWNTRIVTSLLNSAKGDLILDGNGDLCYRRTYDDDGRDLPWAQHTIGERLANIGWDGWMITPAGAQFILENCSPGNKHDMRKLAAIASCRTGA